MSYATLPPIFPAVDKQQNVDLWGEIQQGMARYRYARDTMGDIREISDNSRNTGIMANHVQYESAK